MATFVVYPELLPLQSTRARTTSLLIAESECERACHVPDVRVVGIRSLEEAVKWMKSPSPPIRPSPAPASTRPATLPDLADVRGHRSAKRALEVAAAGGHHLLLMGPPGCGKSMLAKRLPGLLPGTTAEEALEIWRIHDSFGDACEGTMALANVHFGHLITAFLRQASSGTETSVPESCASHIEVSCSWTKPPRCPVATWTCSANPWKTVRSSFDAQRAASAFLVPLSLCLQPILAHVGNTAGPATACAESNVHITISLAYRGPSWTELIFTFGSTRALHFHGLTKHRMGSHQPPFEHE